MQTQKLLKVIRWFANGRFSLTSSFVHPSKLVLQLQEEPLQFSVQLHLPQSQNPRSYKKEKVKNNSIFIRIKILWASWLNNGVKIHCSSPLELWIFRSPSSRQVYFLATRPNIESNACTEVDFALELK